MQFLNKLSLLLILTLLCINNAQADTDKYKQAEAKVAEAEATLAVVKRITVEQLEQVENDAKRIIKTANKLITIKQYALAESMLLTGMASAEKTICSSNNSTCSVVWGNMAIFYIRPLFVKLAEVYKEQEKYDESKVVFLNILKTDKETLLSYIENKSVMMGSLTHRNLIIKGLNKNLAEDYSNVGSIQYLQNDIEAAATSFLSSLNIYLNTPLKDDELLGGICVALGGIRRVQSEYDDAEILFLHALKVAEKLYGKEDAITQDVKGLLNEVRAIKQNNRQ